MGLRLLELRHSGLVVRDICRASSFVLRLKLDKCAGENPAFFCDFRPEGSENFSGKITKFFYFLTGREKEKKKKKGEKKIFLLPRLVKNRANQFLPISQTSTGPERTLLYNGRRVPHQEGKDNNVVKKFVTLGKT